VRSGGGDPRDWEGVRRAARFPARQIGTYRGEARPGQPLNLPHLSVGAVEVPVQSQDLCIFYRRQFPKEV
jgi:hypothetical protein